AIAPNGDFWATVRAAEFGAGIYRLQADQDGQPLGQAQRIEPDATVMGNLASGVSVDAEGRIWVSLYGNETSSGGLAAFEVDDELRGNTPVNWLNGPIGEARSGRTTFGTARFWASNLPDVAGVDERVWTGRGDGTLITYAQRWSQLDQGSGLGDKVVREVWTARGRLFAATDTELLVLQPDGHTWESRAERVQDVFADSRGNIWVGTEDGPLLSQLSGWDTLTSRMGPRPSHRVSDFAEDRDGRIWLGGTDGLTLFDRDRFVTTFTAVNSPLPVTPVRALAVDRDNRLWIGTNQGLAVFQNDVEWTVITQAEGLPSNVIRDLVQLADGRMAVSTNGGLVYLGADFSMTFDTSVPLTTNLWRLAVDEFGQLWVDNALRTADGWRVFHDTNSGLRSTEISGVAADQADRIWFGHAPEAGLSVRGSYLPPLGNVFPQFDAVNAITPTVGSNGTIVEIRGSGFGEDPAELAVTIGGTDVEILTVTNQRIRVRIGPDTTSGDVSVSRAGRRVTSADSFRVRPVVTSFTPTGGNDGVRVTITGTNFDRTAQVRLGDGTFRPAFWISPTQLETTILPTDSSGSVSVRNFAPWNAVLPPLSAAGGGEFHRIELELQEVTFNQGILSTGLVAHRETFVQHFLRHSVAPRPEDRLEIDSAVFQFRGSDPIVVNVCPPSTVDCTVPFETRGGDLTNVDRADVLNSFNVTMVPPGDGSWTGVSDYTVRLMRRGFAIDEWSSSIHVRPNMPLRVLLVPIMRNGSTSEDIERVRRETEQGLDELRRRIMPTGDVELYWSPLTFEVKDVLTRITGDARSIDLGNVLELYDASHELDEARSWWNEHRNPEVLVSFGVVDSRVVEADSASGQAFWPDVSAMLNSAGLDVIDTLCDAVDTVVNVLSFGLAGGDGCELDIPLYVGWARHDGNIEVPGQQSDLFGHELGHIMGLVKPWAYNGTHAFPIPFVTDNFSHSVTDELLEGSCDDDDVRFRRDRTLYYQPGVEEPVVNPLSSRQLYRLLGTGENETERGKAIMSYACGGRNYNAFFEPVDLIDIYTNFAVASAGGFVHNLMSGLPLASAGEAEPVASLSAALATPAAAAAASPDATSTRLYLSGVVNRTTGTGLIERMAPREDSSRVSLSVESGYWLVQLDSSGNELNRWGVFPQFSTSDVYDGAEGFFAATILRHPDVARIELRRDDTTLDARQPGMQPPALSLDASPSGIVTGPGAVELAWTASDPDSDPLSIAILFSPDDGNSWTVVARPDPAVNSWRIPVAALANSGADQARLQVQVDDGLQHAIAISSPFTVVGLGPSPWIGSPTMDTRALEGRPVRLAGGALDHSGLYVNATNLQWSSDRDGHLGAGADRQVFLSPGTHQITLRATNPAGIVSSITTTLVVHPDYDHDGLTDSEEMVRGLNPLHSFELFTDVDGDGVNLYVELLRGTNPGEVDSDSDGRWDGLEIGGGTDPTFADEPLPADHLQVFPQSIDLAGDLARSVPFPQQQLALITNTVTDWTMTADVPWLAANQQQGVAPGGVTVLVDAHLLGDGVHTGQLTFTSVQLGEIVTVPVTVTIIHSDAHFDVNGDGYLNSLDSDEVAAREGLMSGEPAFRYIYDLDRDGDIDRDDIWLAYERTNTAPEVFVHIPQIEVDEGSTASNQGTFHDIDPTDSIWISSSIGAVIQTPGNFGSWTWSYSATDGPLQSQTVVITADDQRGGLTQATFDLTVQNVAPTGNLLAPSEVDEGSLIVVELATPYDPSAEDTAATFAYAFDTGSGFSEFATNSRVDLLPLDNSSVIVRGRIRDKDGGVNEYERVVIVRNVAPRIALNAVAPVDENGVTTLTGLITDPGTLDYFTLEVDWGDPESPAIETIYLPASPTGESAFTLYHQYLDDHPTSTATDSYLVGVRVSDDDQGEGQATSQAVIRNIAPRLESVALSKSILLEGEVLTVSGTFFDPGTRDGHEIRIDWGDGSEPTILPATSVDHAFAAEHRYYDDDPTGTPDDSYTITVSVTDDDTGVDVTTANVQVLNVAPVIVSFDSTGSQVGHKSVANPVDAQATFSDVGLRDSHIATFDWGDGQTTAGLVIDASGHGYVSGTHSYAHGGRYLVTLEVTDDDRGAAMASEVVYVTGTGVHNGVLHVVGTTRQDNVEIMAVRDSIQVVASFLTGPHRYPASDIRRLEVYVGA
ncbi:MAG: two-component regulator propeller domain-containing protein, partial [Pirellulaceae bacterium]